MSRAQALLAPLVPLYAAVSGGKNFAYSHGWIKPKRLFCPVISIGNLSVGGAGKTPVVIRLAQLLAEQGLCVDVLSRGYGRSSQDVERVDPEGSASRYGDEPILIARNANVPVYANVSVYVGPDRYEAGLRAEREHPGHGIHLLDDGFQHRRLARDADIVVLHRTDFSEPLLPAGNLREPLSALGRASVLILRDSDRDLEAELRRRNLSAPIWVQHRRLALPPLRRVVAFCGIARPEDFFSALRSSGVELAATSVFRDHHTYTDGDVGNLLRLRDQHHAEAFITTEKDWVRLSPQQQTRTAPLDVARLEVVFDNEPMLMEQLLRSLVRK